MVVTLGQQYNVGEKPTVKLYTYINRHAGPLLSNYVIRCSIRGTSLYHILCRSTKSTAVSTAVVGETDITTFTICILLSPIEATARNGKDAHNPQSLYTYKLFRIQVFPSLPYLKQPSRASLSLLRCACCP